MNHLVAPELNSELQKGYQAFHRRVGAVADRHRLYLEEEQTTIEDCYTLELRYGNARIEINRWLPIDLYEELHQCFMESFS